MTAVPSTRMRRRTLVVTLLLLGLLALAAALEPRDALHAWYAATLFWTGIPLGALAVLMIHHLTSGRWGWYLRPLLGAAIRTLPLVLLAYLPLLATLDILFPWTEPREGLPEVVRRKLAYLNEPFFLARAAVYGVIWLGLAFMLSSRHRPPGGRRRGLAALGLILYGLTITFYGVDWVQSLEPKFYSSAIGYVMATGQFVAVLAVLIVAAAWLRPLRPERETPPFHDLGNLLLAAVMLWTYIAFARYLIIWITDLPHEIEWYLHRQSGTWLWLTVLLILLHACLPLTLLLFRRIKQNPALLAAVAGLLLLAHVLDVFWLVLPSFGPRQVFAGLIDVLALLALGGLWLVSFFSRLEVTAHERHA